MTIDVATSWGRIVAWLRERAPATAAAIRAPATDELIDDAEREVGAPFPADLRAWYRQTDGIAPSPHPGTLIPQSFVSYPISYALDSRRTWLEACEMLAEEGDDIATLIAREQAKPAGSPCYLWLPKWMPVATDYGGLDVFVDLRDGPAHGCVMTYDKVGACDEPPLWPSVSAMLHEIAEALDRDTVAGGCRPTVDADKRLDWRLPDGLWIDRFPTHEHTFQQRLDEFTTHARADDLGDKDEAELIVARVARVLDALLSTAEQLENGQDARYDDPDPRDTDTLRAYADSYGGRVRLADRILDTGGRLRTLLTRFEEDHDRPGGRGRAPLIPATVRESGDVVIDDEVSWPGLASGTDWYLYHCGRTLASMRPRERLRR
jgi:cell wall assembly regulator SMI1